MAVAPSTIVFGLLTCIPFGLAIKDTVSGVPARGARGPLAEYEAEQRMLEQRAAEVRRRNEEYQRERAAEQAAERERTALLGELFASDVNVGRKFDHALGAPMTVLPAQLFADQAAFEAKHDLQIRAETAGGVLHGIAIEPEMDGEHTAELCDAMESHFTDAWGGSALYDDKRIAWLSEDEQRRAVMLRIGRNCKVMVELTSTLDAWVGKTQRSIVPVWAVGQPAKKLAEALKVPEITGDTFEWSTRGLGAGIGKTELVAHLDRGKIVAVVAHASHHFDSIAVEDHLTSVFGPASDADPYVWKTKPPMALVVRTHRVRLTVGKLPE